MYVVVCLGCKKKYSDAMSLESTCPKCDARSLARVRTCNMHDDCDAADLAAVARGKLWASHCNDDCCEDCFGT